MSNSGRPGEHSGTTRVQTLKDGCRLEVSPRPLRAESIEDFVSTFLRSPHDHGVRERRGVSLTLVVGVTACFASLDLNSSRSPSPFCLRSAFGTSSRWASWRRSFEPHGWWRAARGPGGQVSPTSGSEGMRWSPSRCPAPRVRSTFTPEGRRDRGDRCGLARAFRGSVSLSHVFSNRAFHRWTCLESSITTPGAARLFTWSAPDCRCRRTSSRRHPRPQGTLRRSRASRRSSPA